MVWAVVIGFALAIFLFFIHCVSERIQHKEAAVLNVLK